MQIKRRMFRRTETVEQIKVKMIDNNDDFVFAENRTIEGERFICRIFRVDGNADEQLFECGLQGKIEIEQTSAGGFTLVARSKK